MRPAQQIRHIYPMFDQCWANVVDGGPTLGKHWVDVSCLLWISQLFLNPLTTSPDYIRVFRFLLAHYIPVFKHVKDKTWHESTRWQNHPVVHQWLWAAKSHWWVTSGTHVAIGECDLPLMATDGPLVVHHRQTMWLVGHPLSAGPPCGGPPLATDSIRWWAKSD